jgi:hypothetical protein
METVHNVVVGAECDLDGTEDLTRRQKPSEGF